jgi:hypothetical protein
MTDGERLMGLSEIKRILADCIGCFAAFLLVASCGADLSRECLRKFNDPTLAAAVVSFIVPLVLIWLAGNWIARLSASRDGRARIGA